jgi:hypothetical protein
MKMIQKKAKGWWEKVKNLLFVLTVLFLTSYVLNFVWEALHAVFLYQGHDFSASQYVPMVAYVATVDAFLVLGMFGITVLVVRDLAWISHIEKKSLTVFLLFGLLFAAFIEYRAIFVEQRWSYTALMPTLFGLGLSPLLQLGLTGLIALFLCKQLVYGRKIY